MQSIKLKSYAKINLALDVIEKLPNGYHSIDGIMQIVDLYDVVTVSIEEKNANNANILANDEQEGYSDKKNQNICNEFKVIITSTSDKIPLSKDNIVYKAYEKIKQIYDEVQNEKFDEVFSLLRIHIEKNIPIEAGLAGGSGNGAVTLLALNKMLKLELGYEELCEIGKSIGADVPFSLSAQIKANENVLNEFNGKGFFAARTKGIGEILTEVTPYKGKILISKPIAGISTKEVYENLRLDEASERPNVADMIEGLKEENFNKIAKNMINLLESYSLKVYDSIVYTKNKIREEVLAGKVMMSGSGPTVFAISPDECELERAYCKIKEENLETIITKTMY